MSGVSAFTSGQDGEPADMLFQPVDAYSAALAVISIQSALIARERTGRGQRIDVALLEGGTAFVNANVPDYLRKKAVRKRGFPSIGNLKCKDGKYLSSAASAQAHFWVPFCDAVGLPQLRETRPVRDEAIIRQVMVEVLQGIGYGDAEIEALAQSGVVRASNWNGAIVGSTAGQA